MSWRRQWMRAALLLASSSLLTTACVTTTSELGKPSDAESAVARRNLGVDHYLNGRVALAIRELKHAVTLNDEDAQAHMWLGEAYRRRGYLELAEAEMVRSLELDPDNHEANLRYSVMMIQLERFDEAIEATDKLIRDPTFESPWRALTNRGWAQLKLGQFEASQRSFEGALDYQVAYWPAILNLGILANIQGDYAAALQHLDSVIQSDPGAGVVAEANYRMAEVYVSLGMRERALKHLGTAIDLSPNGRWGKQSRVYLRKLGGA